MPKGDPRDGFSYPTLKFIMDSYNPIAAINKLLKHKVLQNSIPSFENIVDPDPADHSPHYFGLIPTKPVFRISDSETQTSLHSYRG